jgi:hypothetical protein
MRQRKEDRMKRPDSTLCLVVLLAGLSLASCGSGGGNVPGGNGGGAITATFTPSNPAPGANSISLAAGAASGDTFQVTVVVSDIVEFFGTAFRITFDSSTAEFLSFDGSGSFLYDATIFPGSPVVDIRASVDPADAGTVLVVATIQNSFSYVPGANAMGSGDQVLLELTFRATDPTGGNAFTFDSSLTREVTTCPPWGMVGPTPDCPEIVDGLLNWNGGMMTAN